MIELLSCGAVMTEEAYEAERRQSSVVIERSLCMPPLSGHQILAHEPPAPLIEGSTP